MSHEHPDRIANVVFSMAAVIGCEATSDNPAAAVWMLPSIDDKWAFTCARWPTVSKASSVRETGCQCMTMAVLAITLFIH